MATPLVSVLLPVRNGMPYIPETIDSIVGQTFEDWELIVSDNASDDGTADYVASRAIIDPRIKLLRGSTNLGAAGGVNRALEIARAPWFAIIDGDDRALPQRLERQLAFMLQNPDVCAISCLAYYINAKGRRVARTHHDLTTRAAYHRYMSTNEVMGLLHPGAFIKRDAMEAIGGYRPEYEPAEDIDLWNRLSEHGVVLVQPLVLMEYRIHPRAVSSRRFIEARTHREWCHVSMIARRSGRQEPTWEQFQRDWNSAPLLERINRSRLINAEKWYRQAGLYGVNGRFVRGAVGMAVAALLRPAYTLRRLTGQLMLKRGAAAT